MHATPTNLLLLIAAGSCTGIVGAILGTGGGVFLIPLLVLGFGVPMHYAIATSIISVVATSSAVASTNVERGTANMRLGMTLEIATATGAILGGLTAAWISPTHLELLFAVVLLPTAASMWRGREDTSHQPLQVATESVSAQSVSQRKINLSPFCLRGSYFDPQLGSEVEYQVQRLWAGLLVSLVAGNLSGLLGIGGGVFKVPALHLLCHVPIKAAAATSNFMIGVTAAASAFLYFGRGEVRPVLTATVVLGVLAGSAAGSYFNRFIQGRILNRLFAILLLGVAIQMAYRVFWIGN
jgi:uncharacterized membrane protein YfcA